MSCRAAAPRVASGCRPETGQSQSGVYQTGVSETGMRSAADLDDRAEPDSPDLFAARWASASMHPAGDTANLTPARAPLITLKKRAEFARVRGGQRWSGRSFLIEGKQRIETTPEIQSRVGFTITKKIGGAVERNRMRRRLKAAMQDVLTDHGRPGFDYVVVARRPALTQSYAALVADCRTALMKLHAPAPRAKT
jgi:ribonuclease P protein component